MGCNSCGGRKNPAAKVNTNKVSGTKKTKKKSEPKPVTKFMHIQGSSANRRRAFNTLQARAQKIAKRKEKQI